MKKYVIIDADAIQKRIEELEQELAYHNEWYKKARENYDKDRKFWRQADDGEMRVASDAASTTAQEIKILKQLLSQSTPLIPEIEKALRQPPVSGELNCEHDWLVDMYDHFGFPASRFCDKCNTREAI